MSNVQKTTALVETSRQGPDTPLAHRRPRSPLVRLWRTSQQSLPPFLSDGELHQNMTVISNHWTSE